MTAEFEVKLENDVDPYENYGFIPMSTAKKLWYRLTAWYPRKLPRTATQYAGLKDVLRQAFGLRDEPATWATAAGQVSSTQANKARRPLTHIVNAVRRIDTNKCAAEDRQRAMDQLRRLMARAAKDFADHEASTSTNGTTPPLNANSGPQQNLDDVIAANESMN